MIEEENQQIDCTPYARVDVQKVETNIANFARLFKERNISIRPHIKTHKCPEIAKLQMAAGATGLTVATLFEARAMLENGVSDIFLAYPVVGSMNLALFNRLREMGRVSSAVDSVFHLQELLSICSADTLLSVRIEIDSGQHRCGVLPEKEQLQPLVEFIKNHDDKFDLEGIFTHAGHVYKCHNQKEVESVAISEQESICKAAEIIETLGLQCKIRSVGSTPTAIFTENPQINECRPGNYVFFDAIQVANGTTKIENCALTIVSRVIGAYKDHIVIDAGSKALGLDKGAHGLTLVKGFGQIVGFNALEIVSLSEEHGIVKVTPEEPAPKIGQLIEIVPNHSCAAANMFSHYQVFRKKKYIATWPLAGQR
jgi:D-serine deaminase-like pyridoxal phosphate-dependent protein